MTKCEHALEDLLAMTEDWFYYLQDLLDLQIPKLRKALITHLMNEFFYSVLLNPLMAYYHQQASSSPIKSEEINEKEEQVQMMNIIASLVYVLQLLRIVSDPLFHKAALLALYHPLSQVAREGLLDAMYVSSGLEKAGDTETRAGAGTGRKGPLKSAKHYVRRKDPSDGVPSDLESMSIGPPSSSSSASLSRPPTPPSPVSPSSSSAAAPPPPVPAAAAAHYPSTTLPEDLFRSNIYRTFLFSPADCRNQKLTLIVSYIFHLLITNLIDRVLRPTHENGGLPPDPPYRNSGGDDELNYRDRGARSEQGLLEDGEDDDGSDNTRELCSLASVFSLLQSTFILPGDQVTPLQQRVETAFSVKEGSGENRTTEDASIAKIANLHKSRLRPNFRVSEASDEHGEGNGGEDGGDGDIGGMGVSDEQDVVLESYADLLSLPMTVKIGLLIEERAIAVDDSYDSNGSNGSGGGTGASDRDRGARDRDRGARDRGGVGDHTPQKKVGSEPPVPMVPPIPYIQSLIAVIQNTKKYSISVLQVAVHSLYYIICLLHKVSTATTTTATASEGNDDQTLTPTAKQTAAELLERLTKDIRAASRSTAAILMERLDTSNGTNYETTLHLIKDEISRFDGRKWSSAIKTMLRETLLFLPSTSSNLMHMGVDFDIPVCQVELLRKDVLVFLMERALFKQTYLLTLLQEQASPSIDDLCASVKDESFLYLDFERFVPTGVVVGAEYNMKGKRFLDAFIAPIMTDEPGLYIVYTVCIHIIHTYTHLYTPLHTYTHIPIVNNHRHRYRE